MDLTNGVSVGFTVVASGLAAYLGAYVKRKGENLATKEDLGDLVAQTKALTEATKRIEATISQEVWNKQKQWELKREKLIAALEPLGLIDGILIRLSAAMRPSHMPTDDGAAYLRTQRDDAATEWASLMDTFDGRRRLLMLVCSRRTGDVFREAGVEIRKTFKLILAPTTPDLATLGARCLDARESVFNAARAELGLDPLE